MQLLHLQIHIKEKIHQIPDFHEVAALVHVENIKFGKKVSPNSRKLQQCLWRLPAE